ncbi:MAG: hypothetical protein HRT88_00530 [Lentisphaeraceae bacterium]|nr:hypothetical protein [Lentisphaeraceae bacterium]
MASLFYDQLISTLRPFMGDKAEIAVNRQIKKIGETEGSFEKPHYEEILPTLRGSVTLYCVDQSKKLEALQALAGLK